MKCSYTNPSQLRDRVPFQVARPVQQGFRSPVEAFSAICCLQAHQASRGAHGPSAGELQRLCTGQAALLGKRKGLKCVISHGKGGFVFPRRKRAQHKTGSNHVPSCLSAMQLMQTHLCKLSFISRSVSASPQPPGFTGWV